MTWIPILFGGLIAATIANAQALDPKPVPARVRGMDQRLARLSASQRIALLEAGLKANPRDLRLQTQLAQAYLHRMRETTDHSYASRAQKIIDRVLSAEPEAYDALRLQTEIDLFRHEFAKAASRSRKLAEVNPKDPVNFATLGDALMETGQYDDAATAYQKMVDLQPDLMSLNRIGWWRFVTGDMEGAIDMMIRAVRSGRPGQENTAWVLVELGNLYRKSGKLQEAEGAYHAALQNFAGMHSAHAGLGYVYAAQGKTSQAIEALKKAQAMAPMLDYAGGLANLYELTGDKEELRKQLENVGIQIKMEALSGQKANREAALIYANHNRNLKEALEAAEADLAIRKDIYTWDAYAWVLFRSGRVEESAKAMKQALRANTPEALFFYHAGMIAQAQGDTETAAQHLRRALKLNPRFDAREARVAVKTLEDITGKRYLGNLDLSIPGISFIAFL